jgi:hypothetical protein
VFLVREFGRDSLRLYEMFMGPLDNTKVGQTRYMLWLPRHRYWLHDLLRVALYTAALVPLQLVLECLLRFLCVEFGGDSLRLYEMFMEPLRDTKVSVKKQL